MKRVAAGEKFEPLDVAKVSPFIVESHRLVGVPLIPSFYPIRLIVKIFSTKSAY
jgi:hypothetical protein